MARSKVMQAWIDHSDKCFKCQMARNSNDMCEIGKEMSPAVEADIRRSMVLELAQDENLGEPAAETRLPVRD